LPAMTTAPNLSLLLCLTVAAVFSSIAANPADSNGTAEPVSDIQETLTWSTLNFRAGTAGNVFETYGDVFAPIWQNERAVLFLQPYSRNAIAADTDAGTGLGLRALITEDWAVGINTFYDHTWFRGDHIFDVNQFGAGVEVIGTWLDFRANYYLPQTGGHVIGTERIGEEVLGLGDPYGLQHRIVRDVRLLGINRERVVAAGQGWDAEVGTLVPWLDRCLETRAYVGGYGYNNTAGPDITGFKARAEARLTRWLYADAGWIENKAVSGGTWFAGLRISLPLGRTRPALPVSSPLMSSLGYESVARRARDRMNESVERNSQAVLATHTIRTAKQVLVERSTVTLHDDIVFVDSKLGTASGFGTFEHPLSTIQGGVNRSASLYEDHGTVFVQGRSSGYQEGVAISHGVQLYGSGYGLPVTSALGGAFAFQGRTTTTPLVIGGFLAHDIASPVRIAGFDLTGSLTSGWISASGRSAAETSIFLENVYHAIVDHNNVYGSASSTAGIYVETNGNHQSTVLISQNNIHDNPGQPTLGLQGVVLVANNASVLNAKLTANTIARNGNYGAVLATFDSATINATLSGNTISFNSSDQIVGLNFGTALNFISAGTLSNAVLEPSGASSLYKSYSAGPTGFIFINGVHEPADSDLP